MEVRVVWESLAVIDTYKGSEIGWPFFKDRKFCRLLIAIPLNMYSKFDQPKWILVGQMLTKNGQWPAAISSTACALVVNNGFYFAFNQ